MNSSVAPNAGPRGVVHAVEREREARCPVDELSTWFGPLNARLGAEAEQGLEPAPNEVGLLLEMGKLAAEAGPQRFYALLTGFAVGRALGRAERDDATLDRLAFLQKALEDVRAVAPSSDPPC